MADRLYTIERDPQGQTTFVVYDFEAREVKRTEENPHPEEGTRSVYPPFFADGETFWAIVQRIADLDEKNRPYAKRDRF
jgi:hypothetical protein